MYTGSCFFIHSVSFTEQIQCHMEYNIKSIHSIAHVQKLEVIHTSNPTGSAEILSMTIAGCTCLNSGMTGECGRGSQETDFISKSSLSAVMETF